jgi:hypothetical protein
MAFEYPKHPNTGRKDPFRDENGQNPFSDEGPEAEISDNPYGVVNQDTGPVFQTGEFETQYPHRGGRVLALGVSGAALSALGAVGTIAAAFSPSGAGMVLPLVAGMLILGLPISWSAWMLGRHDLRAIRGGAMDKTGHKKTRFGHALGIAGTLIAIVPVVVAVVRFLNLLAQEL